jgi:hypothetical protein
MIFPSPAGMLLTKPSVDGKNYIILVQGGFGWRRENGKPFFTVYIYTKHATKKFVLLITWLYWIVKAYKY